MVEDDRTHAYAVARQLEHAGFKTMRAATGAQALELAEFASLVVLDIYLPDLLGWEVCRLLRARLATARLPIIHMSARQVTNEDARQSEDCGANLFLRSPIEPGLLLREIDALLANA